MDYSWRNPFLMAVSTMYDFCISRLSLVSGVDKKSIGHIGAQRIIVSTSNHSYQHKVVAYRFMAVLPIPPIPLVFKATKRLKRLAQC